MLKNEVCITSWMLNKIFIHFFMPIQITVCTNKCFVSFSLTFSSYRIERIFFCENPHQTDVIVRVHALEQFNRLVCNTLVISNFKLTINGDVDSVKCVNVSHFVVNARMKLNNHVLCVTVQQDTIIIDTDKCLQFNSIQFATIMYFLSVKYCRSYFIVSL